MLEVLKETLRKVDIGFLYFMLILIGSAMIVFIIRKVLQNVLHPIRKVRVQVAHIERQDQNINAVARKMSAGLSIQGNRPTFTQLNMSNMGHAMEDNLIYTFYLQDEDNRKIKLKIQSDIGNNMAKPGDIGYVTYQDGFILSFEKTGNINEQ